MATAPTHEIELNFYYLHWRGAQKLAEWAEKEESKLKSLYARHAILSAIFASEALINRVIADLYLPASGRKHLERLSQKEKWFAAPLVCGVEKPFGETFDSAAEPFQSFVELIDLRNWLVHPKGGEFVEATADGATITVMRTGQEVPWVDTVQGGVWPQTRIPVNPFELTGQHARKAMETVDAMVAKLKSLSGGVITDEWLAEVVLKQKGTSETRRTTLDSLWGGYTPGSGAASSGG